MIASGSARLLCCCLAFVASTPLRATLAETGRTTIADQGRTAIEARTADGLVSVALSTRFASSREAAPTGMSRCSGGRLHCSLVDGIDISIGSRKVDVPRRAMILLADVNWGQVRRLSSGQYELVLDCGDAAAAYRTRLFFDRTRVTRSEIWASEAGRLEETTTYRDLSHAFS